MVKNDQFSPWPMPMRLAGHFDLGSGYLTALALFSAKSGGTENAAVSSAGAVGAGLRH
jgi:hypothetical protein